MYTSTEPLCRLACFAADIRIEVMRMLGTLGTGHVGGSLSVADIMACLYGGILRVDPRRPRMEERDRIVVSKGHCGPAMYAALALRGFFPRAQLATLNQPPTDLPSHTDRNRTPGVDMTTGSLGQGASSAVGIALACRMKRLDCHVYLILGDGECEEGQVWEAAMAASALKLDHLIAIVDCNGVQLDSTVEEILGGAPRWGDKFRAFGWNVMDVADGNDTAQLWHALSLAASCTDGRPTALIAHTVKGAGFSELDPLNCHSIPVTEEMVRHAVAEQEARKAALTSGPHTDKEG